MRLHSSFLQFIGKNGSTLINQPLLFRISHYTRFNRILRLYSLPDYKNANTLISVFQVFNFSPIIKNIHFHVFFYATLATQFSNINGQSVHITEDFKHPYWPEYLDQDTLLFKRTPSFASSNSLTLEKHDYQLKIPIHPNQLLSKIREFQTPEQILKYSYLQKDLEKVQSKIGYFHIRFSADINLSSVNKISLILKDSLNRELKLNWGNTKDQLEVLFSGNLIYSGKPFQYNTSTFIQNVYIEIQSDSLKIFTFTEQDFPENSFDFSQNLHTIQFPINQYFNTPKWAILTISQSGKTAINSHKIHQINWGWGESFCDTISTQINQISNNEIQVDIYSKYYFSPLHKLDFFPYSKNQFLYSFPNSTIQFKSNNAGLNIPSNPFSQFNKTTSIQLRLNREVNPNWHINPKDSISFSFDSLNLTISLPINIKNIIIQSNFIHVSTDFNRIECRTSITHLDSAEPENIYISEILTDPEPHFGRIPAVSFIEIVNQSDKDLNLETIFLSKNSEYSDATNIGYRIPVNSTKTNRLTGDSSSWRFKNRFPRKTRALVIYSKDSTEWFRWFLNAPDKAYNDVFLISCPDLPRFNYSDGFVYIFNIQGQSISNITYNKEMHNPELKEGGISLEMISSDQPHSWELNAKSNSNFGGSPGISNSIDTSAFPIQTEVIKYKIIDAFCSEDSVYLIWNHNLPKSWPTLKLLEYRSNSDIPVDSFLLNRRNNILTAFCGDKNKTNPCSSKGSFFLDTQLLFPIIKRSDNSTIFHHLVNHQPIQLHFGDSKNLRFNEILSNNFTGFSDFIELVNNDTTNCVDLENWDLLYYDENRILKNIIPLRNANFRFIEPNKCKAFTDDRYSLYRQFPQFYPFNIAQSMRFPDIPTTTGTWALNHHIYGIQDEINMSILSKEFPNIAKGYSLEKIHPSFESNIAENWFPFFSDPFSSNNKNSNSSIPSSGATPGKMNSNYQPNESLHANWLTLTNRIVKINNFHLLILPIDIHLPLEGYSLSAALYNSSGRQICTLDLPKQLPQKASLFVNLPREIQFNGNYVIKFEATLPNHPTKRKTKRFTVVN